MRRQNTSNFRVATLWFGSRYSAWLRRGYGGSREKTSGMLQIGVGGLDVDGFKLGDRVLVTCTPPRQKIPWPTIPDQLDHLEIR